MYTIMLGLLTARVYSLYEGSKVIIMALILSFLLGFILNLFSQENSIFEMHTNYS